MQAPFWQRHWPRAHAPRHAPCSPSMPPASDADSHPIHIYSSLLLQYIQTRNFCHNLSQQRLEGRKIVYSKSPQNLQVYHATFTYVDVCDNSHRTTKLSLSLFKIKVCPYGTLIARVRHVFERNYKGSVNNFVKSVHFY